MPSMGGALAPPRSPHLSFDTNHRRFGSPPGPSPRSMTPVRLVEVLAGAGLAAVLSVRIARAPTTPFTNRTCPAVAVGRVVDVGRIPPMEPREHGRRGDRGRGRTSSDSRAARWRRGLREVSTVTTANGATSNVRPVAHRELNFCLFHQITMRSISSTVTVSAVRS